MRAALVLAIAALWGPGAQAQQSVTEDAPIALPSGLVAYTQEIVLGGSDGEAGRDGQAVVYHFRYVAAAFTGQEAFEAQTTDLEFLCQSVALPDVVNLPSQPDRVVISLADKRAAFGVFDPDVVQIFETFSLQNGTCILEIF